MTHSAHAQSEGEKQMGKRLLIVDDDKDLMLLLLEFLSDWGRGYNVEIAYSGEEALTKMAVSSFDLIITDLYMPGMDGLALIEHARERWPNTSLVLMTGCRAPEIAEDVHALGVHKVLSKPFSKKRFLRLIQLAIEAPVLNGT